MLRDFRGKNYIFYTHSGIIRMKEKGINYSTLNGFTDYSIYIIKKILIQHGFSYPQHNNYGT